ncbi:hypothetical protein LRS73_05285 [Methylobacterium currus]|uniref:hypothetical protein n=1 Tax=Methylobacterium currus TaxID=2051553 RepID=UPI001E4A7D29|nr:hypothetical protein [Methylobacterium currus]UHC17308.1 hypothetical protein LRS73_05285 [Methylobacterium currus]
MPVDHRAFERLISLASTPKMCVTRVTCVTANYFNGLGGHTGRDELVTCVTATRSSAACHALSDCMTPNLVTDKHQQDQHLAGASHAVTRSRTKNREQEKCRGDGLVVCPIEHSDWLAEFEERAAILEFDGGHNRTEAERLAGSEMVATPGPIPRGAAR